MSEQLEILKEFPVKIQITVAWTDMDIYGHINNSNYFKYFDSARIKYFETIGLYDQFEINSIAGVLSNISCNYIVPLKYPDIIIVGIRVVEIKNNEIKMEHFISNSQKGLVAFGESEIVIFDFNSSKKIKIPQFVKIGIEKLENQLF
jgi:acyl-CoA thioester hydrolase